MRSWQCGAPETHCVWPYTLLLQKWAPFLGYISRFVIYEKKKKQRSLSRKGEVCLMPPNHPPPKHTLLFEANPADSTDLGEKTARSVCTCHSLWWTPLFPSHSLSHPNPVLIKLPARSPPYYRKLKKDGIDAWARGTLLVAVVTTNERFPERRWMGRSHDPSQCPVSPGGLGFGFRKGAGGGYSSYRN